MYSIYAHTYLLSSFGSWFLLKRFLPPDIYIHIYMTLGKTALLVMSDEYNIATVLYIPYSLVWSLISRESEQSGAEQNRTA